MAAGPSRGLCSHGHPPAQRRLAIRATRLQQGTRSFLVYSTVVYSKFACLSGTLIKSGLVIHLQTMLAKALATESGLNFIAVKGILEHL